MTGTSTGVAREAARRDVRPMRLVALTLLVAAGAARTPGIFQAEVLALENCSCVAQFGGGPLSRLYNLDARNAARSGLNHQYSNLKAVLGAGAKPQLAKVDAALTHVEGGSDLKWLDGGDAYEFTRRSTYVARDAAEEARLDNTEVVGLNPAYLATIDSYGSEGAMLQNLSHVAVSKVAEVLLSLIHI